MIHEKNLKQKFCDTVPLKKNISAQKNALMSLHKTLYTISWDYPFKKQSKWIFEKKYTRIYFFNIEFSQIQLSLIPF